MGLFSVVLSKVYLIDPKLLGLAHEKVEKEKRDEELEDWKHYYQNRRGWGKSDAVSGS